MNVQLRPLDRQVMVITGASSGIGLVTAKQAAERGARVVLAARNKGALAQAVHDIKRNGGRAVMVAADVADPREVDRIADTALQEFGQIDTWINNASVSVYGRLTETPIADMRRQMDVNYWGYVYGCLTAVRQLRSQGGAIINVGSALSDRAIPLQGNYCAAKHAVKAFTDTLRMELEEDGVPISVTLVKPASVDTPFFEKAKTYLGVEPQPIPPVYAPEVVSEVILHAAEHPMRELVAGGAGAILSFARFAPRATDLYMERYTFDAQRTNKPAHGRPDNLYEPVSDDGGERGRNWQGATRETSVYTRAWLHPASTAFACGAVALGFAFAAGQLRHRRQREWVSASA